MTARPSAAARATRDWRFAAGNTHLYPGARLRLLDVAGGDDGTAPQAGDTLAVEFADLGVVHGRVRSAQRDSFVAAMRGHTTARGTAVAPRVWQIVFDPAAGIAGGCRVRARADGA